MPRQEVLRYVPSPQHRTVLVDGVATRIVSDLIGDSVLMSFTRMESMPTGENVTILDDGRIQVPIGQAPLLENFKTIEFTVQMRPDVAVETVNSIFEVLKRMSPTRRAFYGIPDNLPEPITGLIPEQGR